ncbi:uncharacterized protein ASPGLDRAFT_133189, partial [Aspergillus glaucus CBS 516.65]
QHLVSMATQAYGYWKDARFALQPISRSEDGKPLTVKFWWMPMATEYDCMPATDIPEFPANLDSAPRGGKLYNTETELKIASGEEITFHIEDPVEVPLPLWELLEMQWIMHRIAGMLGPKETFEQEWEDYPSEIEYQGPLYQWKR